MREAKKVTYSDYGIDKVFVISPMAGIPALLLAREIVSIFKDHELCKSVVMQQFVNNVLQTGVKLDGVNADEYKALLEMDTVNLISLFISSTLTNLDDEKLQKIIEKCFNSVTYLNGTEHCKGNDALSLHMVEDFVIILALVKDILIMNFAGAIERTKKLLSTLL